MLKNYLYIVVFLCFTQLVVAGNSDKVKSSARVITGKVTDLSGESIAGAKISVTETGETVFADMDGNFSLSVKTDKEYSIMVNTIGFQPLLVKSTQLSAFSDLSLKSL